MSKNITPTEEVTQLFEAILTLESVDECYKFFDDLCTIAEMGAFAQRLDVAVMLSQGMTYAEIEHKTGASTATISRINKALLRGEGGYRTAIARLAGKKK